MFDLTQRGMAGAQFALQFGLTLARMLVDVRRHLGLVDRLCELRNFAARFTVLAELLVDRLQLLAQQHVALRFGKAFLRLIADFAR